MSRNIPQITKGFVMKIIIIAVIFSIAIIIPNIKSGQITRLSTITDNSSDVYQIDQFNTYQLYDDFWRSGYNSISGHEYIDVETITFSENSTHILITIKVVNLLEYSSDKNISFYIVFGNFESIPDEYTEYDLMIVMAELMEDGLVAFGISGGGLSSYDTDPTINIAQDTFKFGILKSLWTDNYENYFGYFYEYTLFNSEILEAFADLITNIPPESQSIDGYEPIFLISLTIIAIYIIQKRIRPTFNLN